jgi:hypothetical protein
MKTHMVVIDFAKQYGVKEGLILTELCRRVYISGTQAIPFSVSQGKAFFPYLSVKQIRLSLQKLKDAGCITIRDTSRTLDRTRQYHIQEKIYQFYLAIIMANQCNLQDSISMSRGGQ